MIGHAFHHPTQEFGREKDSLTHVFDFIGNLKKFYLVLALMVICLFLFSQESASDENPIYLNSQRMEYFVPTKKILVQGDVTLKKENLQVSADEIVLDLFSGKGMATGDIHFDFNQEYRMDTDILEFNIQTGWWRIQSADMRIEPSGHIHFQEAERTDSNMVYMIKPRFTTCIGKSPPWEIRGKRGVLRPGKSLKLNHLTMRIKGIPIFYFPAAYVPIKETGSTGLQPPEAGHSSKHGFFLKNRFIWPVTRHTEGHVFLDFFTQTGIGLGTGWKYAPERENQRSEAKFYLVRENSPDKTHGKADLLFDIGNSDRKRGVMDIHYTTERDYDQKFSFDRTLRDLKFNESRAFISLHKSKLDFLGEWEHIRSVGADLNRSPGADSNKSDIHQLPKLTGHIPYSPFKTMQTQFSPFWGLDFSMVHMDWDLPEEKDDGERYTVEPRLGFQIPGNHWASLNSTFSSKQTYCPDEQRETEDWSRTYAFNLILTGPRMYKSYQMEKFNENEHTDGLKHLIYPRVVYEYETHDGADPSPIEPSSIMNFENTLEEMRNIRFLLINRFWKNNSERKVSIRPLFDLILSHTLNTIEEKQIMEIRLLTDSHMLIRFNGRGQFLTKGGQGRDIDLDFSLGKKDKGEIFIGWRHLLNDNDMDYDHDQDPNRNMNERLNTTHLRLTSPRWKGYQLMTSWIHERIEGKDFKIKNRIEETYSIFYQHTCWKARFSYIREMDEDIVRADLNLIF